MSKLKGPDHNGESGQIAGKVFYRQFGQQLARAVPTPTTQPPSEAQLDQRMGRFAPAFKFAQQMKYAAKLIYQTPPSSRTAFSQMTKQIFPAFTGTKNAPVVTLINAVLGNGVLPMVPLTLCTNTTPDTVVITWDSATSTPDELATDTILVMISSDDGVRSSIINTGKVRSEGTASFDRPTWSMPLDCHVSSIFIIADNGINKSPFQAADPIGEIPQQI